MNRDLGVDIRDPLRMILLLTDDWSHLHSLTCIFLVNHHCGFPKSKLGTYTHDSQRILTLIHGISHVRCPKICVCIASYDLADILRIGRELSNKNLVSITKIGSLEFLACLCRPHASSLSTIPRMNFLGRTEKVSVYYEFSRKKMPLGYMLIMPLASAIFPTKYTNQ